MAQYGGATARPVEGNAVESPVRDGSVQRESAGLIAPGQSALTMTGNVTLSGSITTVPLHKVPAGKLAIVTDLAVSYNSAVQYNIQLQSSGIPVFEQMAKGDTAPVQAVGIETQPRVVEGATLNLVFPAAGAEVATWFVALVEQDTGVG